MDNENENTRQELYERFKFALTQPVSDRFFDEDELIEIYDFAGDMQDDYVQMEALFCGARLYPESVGLAERRAFLYLETNDDESGKRTPAAGQFLKDNPELSSPLFDIARYEAQDVPIPVEGLQFLLDQYPRFSDEETIRFIELACDSEAFEWLVEKADTIAAKCDNAPLVCFELAREADRRCENEILVRFADQLIEAEPFNAGYWIILLRGQVRLDREDDARATFDYAKALASDSPNDILALADIAYTYAPYLTKELLEPLDELRKQYPDEFVYTDCHCALLVQAGMADKAVKELKEFLTARPGETGAMRQLLMCNVNDVQPFVHRYMEASLAGQSEDFLDEATLGEELLMRGAYHSANALFSEIDMCRPISETSIATWLEAIFALGNFGKVVSVVEKYKDNYNMLLRIPLRGAATVYFYAVSLIRCGRFPEALEKVEEACALYDSIMSETPAPLRMSFRTIKTLLAKMQSNPAEDKLYWEYFDLLSYGKF